MLRFLTIILILITAAAMAFVGLWRDDISMEISEAEVQRQIDGKLAELGTYVDDDIRVEMHVLDVQMENGDYAIVTARADADALGAELTLDGRLEAGVRLEDKKLYLTNIRGADLGIKERKEDGRAVDVGGIIGGLLGSRAGQAIASETIEEYLADTPIYDLRDAPGHKAAIARAGLRGVKFKEDAVVVSANLDELRVPLLIGLGVFLLLLFAILIALRPKKA